MAALSEWRTPPRRRPSSTGADSRDEHGCRRTAGAVGTAFLTPPICYNSRGAISSILPPPADFAGFGAFAIYRLFIGTMIYAGISYDDGQNVFCS